MRRCISSRHFPIGVRRRTLWWFVSFSTLQQCVCSYALPWIRKVISAPWIMSNFEHFPIGVRKFEPLALAKIHGTWLVRSKQWGPCQMTPKSDCIITAVMSATDAAPSRHCVAHERSWHLEVLWCHCLTFTPLCQARLFRGLLCSGLLWQGVLVLGS